MNVTCSTPSGCSILVNSKCVYYEGIILPYTGINTNDTVEVALQKIEQAIEDIINGGGGGAAVWGSITGDITDQTDLISYLSSNYTPQARILTINGTAQDLSTNRTWNVGVVTSITGGTGISIGGTSAIPIVTNTAPDQTVILTSGSGISITGTYPSFTITNTSVTGGTVTSVAALTLGTTGIDLSSSVANSTTTPVITLNVPTASATNRGALSSTDWTTFNNKQAAITPAALTRTNDTNVTLTLGGSPTTALLAATSITLGWTGTLAYSRFVDGAGLSVVGRSTNSAGVQADITAGSDYNILRRSGSSIGFGAIDISQSGAIGSSILGVINGGNGLATIAARSIWVANTLNTITTVTPAAGQSIRINAGNTAWEAFTPTTSLAIGDTISGGTVGSVLFVGAASTLAQDNTMFFWDDTNNIFYVGANSGAFTNTKGHFEATVNSYSQVNSLNKSAGNSASTDFVATADNGTDSINYIDFGINSSTYNDAAFTIVGPNDGYVYVNGGDLALGTQTAHDIILHTGGTLVANEKWRVSNSGTTTGTRITASTAVEIPILLLKATSSGVMANGFGPSIDFTIRDTDAVDNLVGRISTVRNGADNTARISFSTASAGSLAERASIYQSGSLQLGTGTASFFAPFNNSYSQVATGNLLGVITTFQSGVSNVFRITGSNNFTGTGGTNGSGLSIGGFSIAQTSGVADFRGINIEYTINQTGTATGITYDIDINPTVTAILGAHIALRATSGQVLLGSTTVTANTRLDVRGIGTGTNFTYRFADSGNTVIHSLADNGQQVLGTSVNLSGSSTSAYSFTQVGGTQSSNPTDGVFARYSADVRHTTGTTTKYSILTAQGLFFNNGSASNQSIGINVSPSFSSFVASWDAYRSEGTYGISSGTGSFNQINLQPTYNYTGTYAGTVRGIYYHPTNTSLTGVTHIALETTSGEIRFAGISNDNAQARIVAVDSGTGKLFYRDASSMGVSGLTTNRIPYATSSTSLGDDATYTWDPTNKAVTINDIRILRIDLSVDDVFIGALTGNTTTTGNGGNVALGVSVMGSITNPQLCTAVGATALNALTSGSWNTAVGAAALATITTGQGSTAVGYAALNLATGGNNTALGYTAGSNITTGTQNVIIGYQINAQSASDSGQLSIQNAIFGLGNTNSGSSVSSGNLGFFATTWGTSAVRVISLSNGTAPGSSITDGIQIWAEDLSASSKLKMRDEAGNIGFIPIMLYGSATLDFPSTTAGTNSDLTITVTGAADGDVISLGVPNASIVANSCYTAWVSAANTVTVRFNNYDILSASNPASGTFKVTIFKS